MTPNDRVVGVDDTNPLSHADGKPTVIKALNLTGPVVMIGDGWNDAEVKLAGAADRFYAYTEIVRREPVVAVADAEVPSMDELLHLEGLPGRWSYPACTHPHAAARKHPPRRRHAAGGGGLYRRDA